MLVFATSDKGGTGRTVTSCNLGYRRALHGTDVCYLDFDFGSPTASSVLHIGETVRDTRRSGLHAYLLGEIAEPRRVEAWSTESERGSLQSRPPGAGRLVLFPGDQGRGEFPSSQEVVERCGKLLLRLEEEFDLCLVDLSAGRSHAVAMALAATAKPEFRSVPCRWLVFHRWTEQHIDAAADLVFGHRGLIETGVEHSHDRRTLTGSIRFVRTVVMDPNAPELAGLRAAQVAWLQDCNTALQRRATKNGIGRTVVLGTVPLDPVLQWREQLITDNDVVERQIANRPTVEAFTSLASKLVDEDAWAGL